MQDIKNKDSEECFICGASYNIRLIENHIFNCEQKYEKE